MRGRVKECILLKPRQTLLDHDIDGDLVERLLTKSNANPTSTGTDKDKSDIAPEASILTIRQVVKLWDLDVKQPKDSAA